MSEKKFKAGDKVVITYKGWGGEWEKGNTVVVTDDPDNHAVNPITKVLFSLDGVAANAIYQVVTPSGELGLIREENIAGVE